MRQHSKAVVPPKMNCESAERKLKIAVVYGRTPLPMRRADQMTVAHLLAFLAARGHNTDLYYIDTGGAASSVDRQWLDTVCNQVYCYKMKWTDLLRGISNVLLKLHPVQVAMFSHPQQKADFRRKVLGNNYDIVYTYYFRSAEITKDVGYSHELPPTQRGRVPASFLAMQLSQTLNSSRIAKNAPNLILKLFYEFESRLVARYEARIWQRFTKSVLIGHSDVDAINEVCAKEGRPRISNYVFGAHGTDVARFTPRDDILAKRSHLVFSGVMRTPTNVQAVQWFATNVWPLIRERNPEATWSIVGREPTAEVLKLESIPGVSVTGTVADPAAHIAEATICINPMQAGGGMQNKLIEYLASQKPVVATSVANEGVNAPVGTLIVADTPREFADAVIDLLGDERKAKEMAKRARAYALENWTWESHFLKLEEEFVRAL